MAAFGMAESLQHPLDFRLMQNAPVSIYHSLTVLEADLATLAGMGYRIDRIDLATCGGQRFYDVVSAALEFQPGFGRNRDAFIDSMRDIEVPDVGGRAIAFVNAQRYPQDSLRQLVDDLTITARTHLLYGKRLICIIQTERQDRHFESSVLSALLNPTESSLAK